MAGLERGAEQPKEAFSYTWYLADCGLPSGSSGNMPGSIQYQAAQGASLRILTIPHQTYPSCSTSAFFCQKNKYGIWLYACAWISPYPSISAPCSLLKAIF